VLQSLHGTSNFGVSSRNRSRDHLFLQARKNRLDVRSLAAGRAQFPRAQGAETGDEGRPHGICSASGRREHFAALESTRGLPELGTMRPGSPGSGARSHGARDDLRRYAVLVCVYRQTGIIDVVPVAAEVFRVRQLQFFQLFMKRSSNGDDDRKFRAIRWIQSKKK